MTSGPLRRTAGVVGRSVARHVEGMPRTFWVLWSGQLVNRLGSVVTPFLSLYLTGSLGRSTAEAGLLVSLVGVGALLSQIIGGVLTDRIGRRATLVLGLGLSALSLASLGFARSTTALVCLAFVTGLVMDLFRPASSAMIADLLPPHLRVRAYGLQFWAVNLGWAVAVTIGGIVADRSFLALFLIDAGTCLAGAAVIAVGVPETRPAGAVTHQASGGLREVLRDRLLLAVIGLNVAGAVVYMQATVTLPLVMRSHGLSIAAFGAVAAVNGIVIVLLQPFAVTRTAKLSALPTVAASQVLIGIGFALTRTAGGSLAAYIATVVVWTLGEILGAGLLAAVVASLAPEHLRGRYMGVWGTSFGVAYMLAPIVGTALLSRGGETTLWAWSLTTSVAVAVGWVSLEPAVSRRRSIGSAPAQHAGQQVLVASDGHRPQLPEGEGVLVA